MVTAGGVMLTVRAPRQSWSAMESACRVFLALPQDIDIIIGYDWLSRHHAVIGSLKQGNTLSNAFTDAFWSASKPYYR
jgi:hypothetical protein